MKYKFYDFMLGLFLGVGAIVFIIFLAMGLVIVL